MTDLPRGLHAGPADSSSPWYREIAEAVDQHDGQIAALTARVAVLEHKSMALLWWVGGLTVTMLVLLILIAAWL